MAPFEERPADDLPPKDISETCTLCKFPIDVSDRDKLIAQGITIGKSEHPCEGCGKHFVVWVEMDATDI